LSWDRSLFLREKEKGKGGSDSGAGGQGWVASGKRRGATLFAGEEEESNLSYFNDRLENASTALRGKAGIALREGGTKKTGRK